MIGKSIGRIRVLGLLGQGGMGTVYEGFDEKLERRVAIKHLDGDNRFDQQTKTRLAQEARLLSRLDHPNICRIYDVIEENNHDFLILELIEGKSLRDLVERGLDNQQKLRIARQIAAALAAAHSEGVVHRDLKPENVMVTPDGVVKVLDFGIAHSTRGGLADLPTVPGSEPLEDVDRSPRPARATLGTPRYMSPEQARGEPVTPATDLYALGLVLQEMFTGDSPYRPGLERSELLALVSAGETRPVAGLDRQTTEMIERLKRFNPGRRLTAAEAVRTLDWILARPQRRMKRIAAAAVLALVVGGSIKYTVDLRRERSRAIQARADSETMVAFLLDDLARSLAPLGRLSLLEKVSEKALDYFDKLPHPLSSDADFIHARALALVSDVHLDKGEMRAAVEAIKQALEIDRTLVGRDPTDPEWRNGLAEDLLRLGELLDGKGDAAGAAEAMNSARAMSLSLVEADPVTAAYRETLGEADYGLGLNVLFSQPDEAIGHFKRSIATFNDLAEEYPDRSYYTYRLAVLHGQGLGQALSLLNRDDRAAEAVVTAHEMYNRLLEKDPSNTRWLFSSAWEKRRLAELMINRDRLDEAWTLFESSLGISRRLLELEPRNTSWRDGLAADQTGLADIRLRQGRDGEALDWYERAVATSQQLVDIEPGYSFYQYGLGEALYGQGRALERLGEHRAADIAWRRALALAGSCAQTADEADLACVELQARSLLRLGRADDAAPLVEKLKTLESLDEDGELAGLVRGAVGRNSR